METVQYTGCVYRATLIVGNRRKRRCYIGRTVMGLRKRLSQHYAQAKRGVKTPFAHALIAYTREAFVWDILFMSNDGDMLDAVEIEQIAAHREQGWRLFNVGNGGGGCTGYKWTPEQIAEYAPVIAARKARGGYDKSPATRAKISAARKGKPGPIISEEGKARIAEAKRAYWAKRKAENLPPRPKDASGKFVKPQPS